MRSKAPNSLTQSQPALSSSQLQAALPQQSSPTSTQHAHSNAQAKPHTKPQQHHLFSSIKSFSNKQPSRPHHNNESLTRLSAPHLAGPLNQFANLTQTQHVSLANFFSESPSGNTTTLQRAQTARDALQTALARKRDAYLLTSITDDYVPYALHLSTQLDEQQATHHFRWQSGLSDDIHTWHTGGLSFETAMVLALSAINELRTILEIPPGTFGQVKTKLSTTTDHIYATEPHQDNGKGDVAQTPKFANDLKSQILCLASAAGKLAYVRDKLAHRALATLDTVEKDKIPPEISTPHLNALHDLTLSLAQALHVRRAQISNMSPSTIVKVAVAAKTLCSNAIQTGLPSALVKVAKQLFALLDAWIYDSVSADFEDNPAARYTALRKAADQYRLVHEGDFAAKLVEQSYLDDLVVRIDDARRENQIVNKEAIPDISEIKVAQGHLIAKASPLEIKSIEP